MEENRSDQLSRDTIVCPSCGGRMVLVDITQRVRGEKLTFRCELCREILVSNRDDSKRQAERR
jgi:tRNA(Ile2) C34 agmatinyltransferase TiaS